jgi:hypothetical protein
MGWNHTTHTDGYRCKFHHGNAVKPPGALRIRAEVGSLFPTLGNVRCRGARRLLLELLRALPSRGSARRWTSLRLLAPLFASERNLRVCRGDAPGVRGGAAHDARRFRPHSACPGPETGLWFAHESGENPTDRALTGTRIPGSRLRFQASTTLRMPPQTPCEPLHPLDLGPTRLEAARRLDAAAK